MTTPKTIKAPNYHADLIWLQNEDRTWSKYTRDNETEFTRNDDKYRELTLEEQTVQNIKDDGMCYSPKTMKLMFFKKI